MTNLTSSQKPTIIAIQETLKQEIATPAVMTQLLSTTFKDFTPQLAMSAMTEGMIRGFEFKDFLEKNIYAIKYGNSYSLVTSVDYARKIGMRSGVCGTTKPIYTEGEKGEIVSCEVTVKRKIGDTIGEFTAEVYFKEYTTGRNLWTSKPRTMIAKVAEMHALRKACPEEMAQMYSEEEMEREVIKVPSEPVDNAGIIKEAIEKIKSFNNSEELKDYYLALNREIQLDKEVLKAKNDMKALLLSHNQ